MELFTCPFCGTEDTDMIAIHDDDEDAVTCTNCGCEYRLDDAAVVTVNRHRALLMVRSRKATLARALTSGASDKVIQGLARDLLYVIERNQQVQALACKHLDEYVPF